MKRKALGLCDDCGHPYPVVIHDNGSIRIMGNAGKCQCGSREITIVGEGSAAGEVRADGSRRSAEESADESSA